MKKCTTITLFILVILILSFGIACGAGSGGQKVSAQTGTTPSAPSPSPTPTPTPTPTPSPVPPANGLPTPPSSALLFASLEHKPGWGSCNSSACAGGSGSGTYWLAANETSPSLDGRSMELYNSGVWANSLWWQKVGANSSATHFLWDFYAQVDDASSTAAQALEFDAFQFVNGFNYMFGSQCNLAAKKWDVWDELNGRWMHTPIPCVSFEPNVWHHIQWYIQRNTDTQSYTFVTLVVDGTSYPVGLTYSAKNLGWGDNVGVQYQLDVNASGAGYHEWVDQSTLTIW